MSYNKVIVEGRITRDIELKQTPTGVSLCKFSVAVNDTAKKDEKVVDFFDCEAWRGTAEFLSKYFQKGSPILLEGKLKTNNYTDSNGIKHYGVFVRVEEVHFTESKKSASDDVNAPVPDNNGLQELSPDDELPF